MNSKNLLIYGSCVSRDTLPYLVPFGFDLVAYVARQSLISTTSVPFTQEVLITESKLTSKFQRDALNGDLTSSLIPTLREFKNGIDCVLLDLVDERGGIWKDNRHRVATNTIELTNSGFLDNWDSDRQHVRVGSDEHFELWKPALDTLVSELTVLGLEDSTFLIANYWASESIEGDVFPFGGSRMDPKTMNQLFQRYYDYVEDVLPQAIIRVPRELCVTTRKHQWGIAAFHYTAEFHEYIAQRMAKILSSRRRK